MSKILVVDDSPTIRAQVAESLTAGGHVVMEATDGVDGLEVLQEHSDIDLVILDVNMPRMGGLEMLEAIKSNPARSNLPVVMLTTEGHQALINRAKAAGARGWVVKPFKAAMLLTAVNKLTLGGRSHNPQRRPLATHEVVTGGR